MLNQVQRQLWCRQDLVPVQQRVFLRLSLHLLILLRQWVMWRVPPPVQLWLRHLMLHRRWSRQRLKRQVQQLLLRHLHRVKNRLRLRQPQFLRSQVFSKASRRIPCCLAGLVWRQLVVWPTCSFVVAEKIRMRMERAVLSWRATMHRIHSLILQAVKMWIHLKPQLLQVWALRMQASRPCCIRPANWMPMPMSIP